MSRRLDIMHLNVFFHHKQKAWEVNIWLVQWSKWQRQRTLQRYIARTVEIGDVSLDATLSKTAGVALSERLTLDLAPSPQRREQASRIAWVPQYYQGLFILHFALPVLSWLRDISEIVLTLYRRIIEVDYKMCHDLKVSKHSLWQRLMSWRYTFEAYVVSVTLTIVGVQKYSPLIKPCACGGRTSTLLSRRRLIIL